MTLDIYKCAKVRSAQANGARNLDELNKISDIDIENNEELKEVESLLKNACLCRNVSIDTVIESVKFGNNTVRKIADTTRAGSGCGRCMGIISNIIENKR